MGLRKPLPAFFAVAALLTSGVLTAAWLFTHVEQPPAPARAPVLASDCDVRIGRVGGFSHVRPLITARGACEPKRLAPLKLRFQTAIQEAVASGTAARASIFFSDLSDGAWLSVNGMERYEPGSLMKVATMLAALMRAEQDPAFAEHRFLFDESIRYPAQQYPPPQDLVPGRTYALVELLRYSSSFSSNRAESVLLKAIGEPAYQSMLNMLGLPAFEPGMSSYPISAPEYASFFEALYGSSLLGSSNSELALGLLGSSTFTNGLRSAIPAGTDVASKFGETGHDGKRQIHEAALVYAGERPYLIVVMTEGRLADGLTDLLKRISKEAFETMTSPEYVKLAWTGAASPQDANRAPRMPSGGSATALVAASN